MPANSAENPTPFERWRSATLAPFEHRAFALFWWASLVSSFGSMIQTVGASWLMATIAPPAEQAETYDFYKVLPKFEVVIPERDKEVRRDVPAQPVAQKGSALYRIVGRTPNASSGHQHGRCSVRNGITSRRPVSRSFRSFGDQPNDS